MTHVELVVYVDEKSETVEKAYLVKFFTVTEDRRLAYHHMIVNEDGEVEKEWDGLQKAWLGSGPGGNQRIGKYWYGSGSRPKLNITEVGNGRCRLESAHVRTVDLEHQYSLWFKNTAFEFDCHENLQREVNGAYSPLNDAHHFATQAFDMYKDWYHSPPLANTPLIVLKFTLVVTMRTPSMFLVKQTFFGDGDDGLHPLVSLDILSHEIAHGVTEESSGLIYNFESGGLNEAFSDMAGKTAERHARGWPQLSWNVGADVSKSDWPFRFMDNPTRDGRSIDHVRNYYSDLDVHFSSGIYNKVFYLLSNKFSFDAWDAFDLFYVAKTKYWHASTTFTEGAELVLKATENVEAGVHLPWFNYDHIDLNDVVDAFYQVGIDCHSDSDRTWSCSKML